MFLIRQSRLEDADNILAVARHLDSVNLPAKADRIEQILDVSEKSFNQTIESAEREYLFVLEEIATKRVVGTSMVYAQHGTKRAPHIYFSVLKDERYSQTIDRYFVHEGLRLGYNYDGPTEIGGLILLPEYRHTPHRLGKLLSFARFLFIAKHRSVFRDRVLAELLPPLQEDGTSVLWEHLGKRFTGLRYQEADLMSRDTKEFIHTLFPHSVIYTALFPKEVRELIGQVGAETRGVETMLRRIGFRYARRIDPFDGGPHFIAETDDIPVIKNARTRLVRAVESADASRPWAIIAIEDKNGFRAMASRVIPDIELDTLGVPSPVRETLCIEPGEQVWTVIP